jgi:signal transduction histidine kinase
MVVATPAKFVGDPPTGMNKAMLVIIGMDPEPAAAARAAMLQAFPGADVISCATAEQAAALPEAAGPEIAAVAPGPEAAAAASAVTSSQLPRWAVVVQGEAAAADASAVPAVFWQPDYLAPVFRLAGGLLTARRENEQFRGDLRAIGTRVAHDLRSPLGGILSTAEAMGENLRAAAPEEAARTKRIIESEEEILRLVRTMSSLTAAFASATTAAAFNMVGPAGAALQRFEPRLLNRGDRVQAPEVWPDVLGDERKTELVWTLLLQNVLKHTTAGRSVTVAWSQEGADVLFTLADDGPGVSADRRNLLFWPFHRLHEPHAARGLGLPTMERLVRLQGGRCRYADNPGGGAVFGFTLPTPG